MKRLRKSIQPVRIKFYAIGEYGTQTKRPHYHILIFGWEPSGGSRKYRPSSKSSHPTYSSSEVSRCWPYGHSLIGSVHAGSCLYVTSYIVDKFVGSDEAKRNYYTRVLPLTGEIIEIEAPFAVMSRRPGLGASYVEKYHNELIAHDTVVHNGFELPLPGYYDKQMVKQGLLPMDKLERTKKERRQEGLKTKHEKTPDRLRAREINHISRHKLFSKSNL